MKKSSGMGVSAIDAVVTAQTLPKKSGLGDRIRDLTRELRQADQVQTQATVRILQSAAVMSQNYDRLVDEVVEVAEHDLAQPRNTKTYTEQALRGRFTSLKEAKSHFDIQARSWSALVDRLNQRSMHCSTSVSPSIDLEERVMRLESNLNAIREEMAQMRVALNSIYRS